MKGIEILANMVRGELPGWYAKPEHCAHMFNYGGYIGDSEMSRCAVCNKTKAELKTLSTKTDKHDNYNEDMERAHGLFEADKQSANPHAGCIRAHPYSKSDDIPICRGIQCGCILLPGETLCPGCILNKTDK